MSLVSSSIQGNYMMPNQAANYNPKTDGVVELTQKNFKTLVLNSDAHWLVIFEFPGPQFVFISPLWVLLSHLFNRGRFYGFKVTVASACNAFKLLKEKKKGSNDDSWKTISDSSDSNGNTYTLWGRVWRIGSDDAFRSKGHGFDSRSSRHLGTLGKSFTHSCLLRFGVKFRHSVRAVSGAPRNISGLEEAL